MVKFEGDYRWRTLCGGVLVFLMKDKYIPLNLSCIPLLWISGPIVERSTEIEQSYIFINTRTLLIYPLWYQQRKWNLTIYQKCSDTCKKYPTPHPFMLVCNGVSIKCLPTLNFLIRKNSSKIWSLSFEFMCGFITKTIP